jgi:hypothetical protein
MSDLGQGTGEVNLRWSWHNFLFSLAFFKLLSPFVFSFGTNSTMRVAYAVNMSMSDQQRRTGTLRKRVFPLSRVPRPACRRSLDHKFRR